MADTLAECEPSLLHGVPTPCLYHMALMHELRQAMPPLIQSESYDAHHDSLLNGSTDNALF